MAPAMARQGKTTGRPLISPRRSWSDGCPHGLVTVSQRALSMGTS